MAKRGPPKKPTALKLIANRGSQRAPSEPAPQALAHPSRPPRSLSGRTARATWRRIAPQLHELGLLSELDVPLLTLYCRTAELFDEAMADVDRDGLTITGSKGGQIKHPSLRVAEAARSELRAILREFGMTPASRAGVTKLENVTHPSEWDGI